MLPRPMCLQCTPGIASVLGVTWPPFSVSVFSICDSSSISTLLQLLLPTDALFCHFRGLLPPAGFLLDQLLGFLSGWNRCGPLWGRPRLRGCSGMGDLSAPRPLPSPFCPFRPSHPPPHTSRHTRAGANPHPPGLPGKGSIHSQEGDPMPLPQGRGGGEGCCCWVGTSDMSFASVSERWGCGPLRVPLTVSPSPG